MTKTKIDTNSGFHQVLSVSGEDAQTILNSIASEQNQMNDFQSQIQAVVTDGSLTMTTNFKTVDQSTGLASNYFRLIENQTQDTINHDFSEKQTQAFTNKLSNVQAKIDGQPTKLIEVELEELEEDISVERERLQELESQFLNIQNALLQSLQKSTPAPDAPEPTNKTAPQSSKSQVTIEEKASGKEQVMGAATAGHALISGISSGAATAGHALTSGISSLLSKKKENKPITSWTGQPTKKLSIPEQCQSITETINRIANPDICNSKGIADELFKTLSKDLITLNQTMSKENRSFFASSKNKSKKGESLLKDMGHVDDMLSNLGKKSPELNGVMDKFGVKFDMKSIKESMSTMVDQMKDILNNVLNKTTSNSVEMNT